MSLDLQQSVAQLQQLFDASKKDEVTKLVTQLKVSYALLQRELTVRFSWPSPDCTLLLLMPTRRICSLLVSCGAVIW